MITKFSRLEFELFTKPSKSNFLRIHQCRNFRKCGTNFLYHIYCLASNIPANCCFSTPKLVKSFIILFFRQLIWYICGRWGVQSSKVQGWPFPPDRGPSGRRQGYRFLMFNGANFSTSELLWKLPTSRVLNLVKIQENIWGLSSCLNHSNGGEAPNLHI